MIKINWHNSLPNQKMWEVENIFSNIEKTVNTFLISDISKILEL